MRRYFLIDASALVPFFFRTKTKAPAEANARLAIVKLLDLRARGKATLYVPNFCMAECSKAFASIIYGQNGFSDEATANYRGLVEQLLELVSKKRKGFIQSLGLKRKHLVDIEDIFIAQWRRPPRDLKGCLSGFDGLILAMGKSLKDTYGSNRVRVVTADEGMANMCNKHAELLPPAVYTPKDPIPDG